VSGSFADRTLRLLRLAAAPRWSAPAIIGLGLLSAMLEGAGLYLFIPLLTQLGTSAGAETGVAALFERALAPVPPAWRVPLLVGGIFLSIVLKNLVGQLNHFVTQRVEGLVAHRLRTRVLRQTIDSCYDYRAESRRTDIATTLATHTASVGTALLQLHFLVVAISTIAVFVALLLLLSPALTALALGFYAVSGAAVQLLMRQAEALGRQVVLRNKEFGMRMWDTIMGLRLIRSCTREEYEIERFTLASENLRRRILRMNMLWAIPQPVSEIGASMLIVGLIVAGVWLGLGVPALAAFLALLYKMQRPVRELLSARVAFDSEWPAAADVEDYVRRTEEPYLTSGSIPFDRLSTEIELRDVRYSYEPGGPPALDGISLTIPRGKTTAIVGRSGSGKSTLMDLLFRFRDPTDGEILVDGVPLRELELPSWRGRLAIMSQEVHLFNDTLEANIGYGRVGATPEEVRRAAGVAGAAEFIEDLPEGYRTLLGDSGVRLSGGQRQRIALARTILRDPDILLLDEPTNALDTESERAFQAALKHYANDRTVIVIAHRLSTVEDADQVVVLARGRVVEQGSPELLRGAAGAYARLHSPAAGPLTLPPSG
jgi:ATP-binding cassette, subfamily B, bacterial MsbA